MADVHLADEGAQRLARFFVDLMLTLAEGGVEGGESAEAVRALWHGTQDDASRLGAGLDGETLVHGLGAVAAALAGQLALERRAAGRSGATAAEVWQELGSALGRPGCRDKRSALGRHDRD